MSPKGVSSGFPGVLMEPGCTLFTVMPRGASSRPNALVIPATAAEFVATAIAEEAVGAKPAVDPISGVAAKYRVVTGAGNDHILSCTAINKCRK